MPPVEVGFDEFDHYETDRVTRTDTVRAPTALLPATQPARSRWWRRLDIPYVVGSALVACAIAAAVVFTLIFDGVRGVRMLRARRAVDNDDN